MDADRNLCIDNIYFLAKKKSLRICDLETSCGVSVGYLARLRKDKNQSFPGTDFLVRVASLLETNIDSLLSFNFRLSTDTERYLYSFISQLTLDSISQKLTWQLDPECIPSPVEKDSFNDFPDHPLLSLHPSLPNQEHYKEIFLSPFCPLTFDLVPTAAYRALLSKNVYVLFVRATRAENRESESPEVETELFLYNMEEKQLSALCHSNSGHPGILGPALDSLFEIVSESCQRTALDQRALNTIDAYMASRRKD